MFAIDFDIDAQAAFLRFGSDLAQRQIAAQPARQQIGPFQNLIGVGADQRVLILRAADPRGNLDVLGGLEIHFHAGNGGDRVLEVRDDGIDVGAALILRLQGDGEVAGIGRGVDRADADHRHDAGDVGIGSDERFDLVLAALHLIERHIGRGFGHRGDQAGVL